jgi:hypothetical protein
MRRSFALASYPQSREIQPSNRQRVLLAAIAGSVGAAEDDMIFGPTGEIIGDKFELEELLLAANNAS